MRTTAAAPEQLPRIQEVTPGALSSRSSARLQFSLRESTPVLLKPKRSGALFDDAGSRPAASAVMERCGFGVAVLRGPGSEVVAQVRELSPELVVFDLASGGSRGLRIVEDFRSAAPDCVVVLLAPFEGLRESALEAGAYELTGKDDLRHLERCLRRLTAELDARDSAARSGHPVFVIESAPQRNGEQESLAVVGEIATAAPGETPSDREPEP